MNKIINILLASFLLVGSTSCGDDFLQTTPSDKLADSKAFTSIEGAQLVLTGAYDWVSNGWIAHNLNQYIFFYPDITGDDALVNPVSNYNRFVAPYQYNVDPASTYSDDPWKGCYSLIDNTNAILDNINSLPESKERDRIEGEALSLRTYAYHFLVRAYAKPVNKYPDSPGVILRLSSSVTDLPRSTVKAVYDQMVKDMERACLLLKDNSSSSKVYIGENAAHGILARLYLDLGDETNGVLHAQSALKGITLMDKSVYKSKFCEINSETLWSFECTADDNQFYLSLPSFWYYCDDNGSNVVSGYSSLRVSKNLIDLMDDNDIRKTQFPKNTSTGAFIRRPATTGGYLTSKIHSRNNQMGQGSFNMLRGSEMYLIIAELAADKSHFTVARDALNAVRQARGLTDYTGADANLVGEIQNERRRELFAEGHRMFDLKRRNLPLTRVGVQGHDLWTNQINLPAGSDKFELPIPQEEFDANKALSTSDQNPEYRK
ncbi:MAG: putative outer membrane protein, involved in nutrient binding [Bacteroidetes bacterium]|nr:putative outer membrane protein, involved in nutrient binding [Bacteroidota bacterium]